VLLFEESSDEMTTMLRAVALLAVLACASCEEDRLRSSIMLKSAKELKDICDKAWIPLPDGVEDPPIETLRALVYEFAQQERPGVPIKPWVRPTAVTASRAEGRAQGGSLAEKMFGKLDTDGDG
jgi:hypothetical protein